MNAAKSSPQPKALQWVVWGGLILVIGAILVAFVREQREIGKGPPLPVLGDVGDFQLTNQAGHTVTREALRDQVWIADIIFTRCPGPCAQMTRQMRELQTGLEGEGSVRLVSLTTDPEFDTPGVLQDYGEKFGADPARWWFLTGTKPEIGRLAIDGLRLVAREQAPAERVSPDDLFIHSTVFVLVDKRGRLRGVFETTGTDLDWGQAKESILAAARRLLRER